MRSRPLLIKKTILLAMIIAAIVLAAVAIYVRLSDPVSSLETAPVLIPVLALLQITPWIVILIDIIRNPVRNKALWMIGLITFGLLVMLLYLLTRDRNLIEHPAVLAEER